MKGPVIRRMFAAATVLALCIVGAACGKKDTANTIPENTNKQGNTTPTTTSGFNFKNRENFTPADLSGEISGIEGNVLTLKTIEVPDFQRGQGQGRRNTTPGSIQNGSNEEHGMNGDRAHEMGTESPDMGAGAGSDRRGPGGMNRPNGDPSNRPEGDGQRNFRRQIAYTGKMEQITLPNDVKITENVRGASGMEQTTVEAKNLKVGDRLDIWYSDKEKKTISRITLRNQPPMPSGNPNNPSGN